MARPPPEPDNLVSSGGPCPTCRHSSSFAAVESGDADSATCCPTAHGQATVAARCSPAPSAAPATTAAPATSLSEIFIGNVPLHPQSAFKVDDDKIAAAFHNSSRKTLNFIPPSVQNGEVIVRPSIDTIRAGSHRWKLLLLDIFWAKNLTSTTLMNCDLFGRVCVMLKQRRTGSSFSNLKRSRPWRNVIEGGPWLYLGQPIVLQKWEPGMVLRKLKHTEVPVWIKLRHLPVELWTTEGLSTVASGIGRPLYPDAITRACTRLDFARVCIMLNVSSKLPKTRRHYDA
ncbi:UNVERIFIED_CONTAM: hypothetical protein Sangu_3198400 [Sesamum angustifolium]|uniref:DUF4283 domain-containing protein n=1 Tax=Sesamum angustifolium TaxID=2727405 RepID=A0AAW2JMA5_9LAMI